VTSSAQTNYALRVLRCHGLNNAAHQYVCGATVVARLTYVASEWCGFTKASDRQRINLVIDRARRLGYCSPDTPTFDELCDIADDQLFSKAVRLWDDVLHDHHHLPPHNATTSDTVHSPYSCLNVQLNYLTLFLNTHVIQEHKLVLVYLFLFYTALSFLCTALHAMQTRSSDENSGRLSVRLSVKHVHCDKTEERSVQIFTPYKRSFSLVVRQEEWLVGQLLLPEILGQPATVGAKSLIFYRYSFVAPQP